MKEFLAKTRGRFFVLLNKILKRSVHVGKGIRLYTKFSVIGKGKVYIGENFAVHGIVGDRRQYVTIETYSPDAVVNIGDNVNLYAARISAKFRITLGNDVLVEESGIVDTAFHSLDKGRTFPEDESEAKCSIMIGSRVCIGARSIILKGVSIGDDVLVGPGSVVARSISSGKVVLGNPAKEYKTGSDNRKSIGPLN